MPGASSSHKSSGKRNKDFFLKPENYSFFPQAYLKMLLLSASMEEAWVNYGHFQECTLIQRCSASLFPWVPADKTALCNGWVSITSGRCRVQQKVLSSPERGCLKHEQPQEIPSVSCSFWFWLCFSALFTRPFLPSKLHYLIKCLIKGYGNKHITEFQSV